MLVADHISIQYGDECVLDNFSCHIARGSFACITGVSGCGKTSLLKSFLGLTPLTEGHITVGGCLLDEHTCSAIRKQVAYLPQDLSLPYETVDEAIRQVLRIGGMKCTHSSRDMLGNNIIKLGLEEDILEKRISEISGGQRQRLMLAVLSLLDREVWLLDEPTAALDYASRDFVIDFLLEQQQKGKTVVAVSHDAHFSKKSSVIIQLC